MAQAQVTGTGMSYSQLKKYRIEKMKDTVKRIALSKGVFGVMVATETWNVITSTFDPNLTHYFKKQIKFIEDLGVAAVRDPDPQNELQFLRVQTYKFEILLSLASDHRVLVVYSSTAKKDPLKGAIALLRGKRKEHKDAKKEGKYSRMHMDPCRPHTKKLGGKEKVIITEKISGTLVDQDDDINKIP